MTPAAFIAKWSRSELRERHGAKSHFNDLCALIGKPNPSDADPTGAAYRFERGATKVGGGNGWADIWRRACFGWEYKGKHNDVGAALRQLEQANVNSVGEVDQFCRASLERPGMSGGA